MDTAYSTLFKNAQIALVLGIYFPVGRWGWRRRRWAGMLLAVAGLWVLWAAVGMAASSAVRYGP